MCISTISAEKHKHHHESELQENWWENLVETSKLGKYYSITCFQ